MLYRRFENPDGTVKVGEREEKLSIKKWPTSVEKNHTSRKVEERRNRCLKVRLTPGPAIPGGPPLQSIEIPHRKPND